MSCFRLAATGLKQSTERRLHKLCSTTSNERETRSSNSSNNVYKQSMFSKVWALLSKHMKKYIEMSHLLSMNCKNLHFFTCLSLYSWSWVLCKTSSPILFNLHVHSWLTKISNSLSFHWNFFVCISKIRDWLSLTLRVLLQYLLENTFSN